MVDPLLEVDLLIVGAGRTGLLAALQRNAEQPTTRLLVVDALPQPGGSIRSQRSQGFLCEYGAFAYSRDELMPLLTQLPAAPALVAAAVDHGWVWTGAELQQTTLATTPYSFRTGNEELVQACRRQLAGKLLLGRAVAELAPTADGWRARLSGEASTELRASEVQLSIPVAAASQLCGSLDPALQQAAAGLQHQTGALLFLGGASSDLSGPGGYGVCPAAGIKSPIAEAIFCSVAFPGRDLGGQALWRLELTTAPEPAAAEAAAAAATAEIQRWTGCRDRFSLRRMHRFVRELHNAAWVECHSRLAGLAARTGNLRLGASRLN